LTIFNNREEKSVKRFKRPKRIVAIGGGHGLGQILRALKLLSNILITGICGSTDFGGITRKAVENHNGHRCLGDVTLGISALADQKRAGALNLRLSGGDWHGFGLRHHMLLSLLSVNHGDLNTALEEMCVWCGTGDHRMMTMTSDQVDLRTRYVQVGRQDQNQFFELRHEGELDTLGRNPLWPTFRINKISLSGTGRIGGQPSRMIRGADYILIGPGSLHGSTIAALMPEGVIDAFKASKAPVIFFLNIFRTPGDPSYHYDAEDFVNEVEARIGKPLNYIVCCSSKNADDVLAKSGRERISYKKFQERDRDGGFRSRLRKAPMASVIDGQVIHDPVAVAGMLSRLFKEAPLSKIANYEEDANCCYNDWAEAL
jgi:uncharacterized cofD-like protein